MRAPSGQPLAALVTVLEPSGRRFSTGEDGVGTERMPEGARELRVWAEGYAPERVRVTEEGGKTARLDVTLQPSRVDVYADRVEIRDKVFFELDSATIKAESFRILDDVVATLQGHPQIELLEIQGHTDDQGAEDYNLTLSQRRADAVMRYLVEAGVEPQRLVAKGYGETRPLQPNATAEARETNRRVAFRILRGAPKPDAPRGGGERGGPRRGDPR